MSAGLAGLVPAAELLRAVAAPSASAVDLAMQIAFCGASALPRVDDDLHRALRIALTTAGVIDSTGNAVPSRASELTVVCSVIAEVPPPAQERIPEPRIVFSAPPHMVTLSPDERLDGLVLDVIRCATNELVIGGAFWNDTGFELLDEVVLPAVTARHVSTTLIVNPPDAEHRDRLVRWTERLAAAGPATCRWYRAPERSMMHAKFVVADRSRGYLGTANLTSWGLGVHVEAGVELVAGQCEQLLQFLQSLERAGAFSSDPPAASVHAIPG